MAWCSVEAQGQLHLTRGEVDHSPPCSAEVMNAWGYTSTPPIRLHIAVLCLTHRNNFTFVYSECDWRAVSTKVLCVSWITSLTNASWID
jgi:hypothetical protein